MKIVGEDRDTMYYALCLVELALIDIRMLQYKPSIIAAAALSLAYKEQQHLYGGG